MAEKFRRGVAGATGPDSAATASHADRTILARCATWCPEQTASSPERKIREEELSELAGVRIVSKMGQSFPREDPRSPRRGPVLERAAPEALRRWREIEEESGRCGRKGIGGPAVYPEAEGERVRQIATKWMGKKNVGEIELGEVEGSSGRRMVRLRGREVRRELIMRAARERDKELEDVRARRRVSGFMHRSRLQSLLRARLFHFITPYEEKRPSTAAIELSQLRDRHTVSVLREGFIFGLDSIFHHQATINTESFSNKFSNSDGICQSQSHTVIGAISDDLQSRNDDSDSNEMPEGKTTGSYNSGTRTNDKQQSSNQEISEQEEDTGTSRMEWEEEVASSPCQRVDREACDTHLQKNMTNNWPHESQGDDDRVGIHSETQKAFPVTEFSMALEHRQDTDIISEQTNLVGRFSTYVPLDYRNEINIELRQLLCRRNVSNINSEFRDTLNQVVQTFIQRRKLVPIGLDSLESPQSPDLLHDNNDQHGLVPILKQVASTIRSLGLSTTPTSPASPNWCQDHHQNISEQSIHQSQIESKVVNDLKAEVARLQEGILQIQRMLDACLDMQQELQRSVRQEVSAALDRYIGEKGIEGQITTMENSSGHRDCLDQ